MYNFKTILKREVRLINVTKSDLKFKFSRNIDFFQKVKNLLVTEQTDFKVNENEDAKRL